MLNKFGLLVWSYNRAAQLDLLLSSLERFCPDQFKIYVLFKAEKLSDYDQGYVECMMYHEEDLNIEFIPETNFQVQTKEILQRHLYMAVSTDDTVVFRPFHLSSDHMKNVDVFSLRYGLNTVVQEPFSGRLQPALTKFADEGETICWDSRLYHPLNNYGFLLGHDLHVYSSKYLELVSELNFSKTNELETKLFDLRNRVNPFIRSFRHSVAVNIPGNNTSGVTKTDNSLPLEEINKKFLDGKRFRINEILEMKVVGCHQCVNLTMV